MSVQHEKVACDTCHDTGEIDETLGGESFSNPHAPCPDCVARVPLYTAPPILVGPARPTAKIYIFPAKQARGKA